MESTTKTNSKKWLGGALGIVTFVAAYAAAQTLFGPPSFDKQMVQMASKMNETLPMMVDEITRLDNGAALPGNVFQYNYTLVTVESEELDVEAVRGRLEKQLINTVSTTPDLKAFRDNKVTLAYSYKDKNGEFLFKILVTPDMYAE